MINRNKRKYTKLKNISKKKTRKLSLIEKTKKNLKKKLNKKKSVKVSKKSLKNKKKIKSKKIVSKYKDKIKSLIEGNKITKKRGGAPRAPKVPRAVKSAKQRGLTAYSQRRFGRRRYGLTDGTAIKRGRFKESSGSKIARKTYNLDTYKGQYNIKKRKVDDIRKELIDLKNKKPGDNSTDTTNRIKELTKKLNIEENRLKKFESKITKNKLTLNKIKLKQQKKSQGFKRWRINRLLGRNKYSTGNLDKTLQKIESGKKSFFSFGRRNVLKSMGSENRNQLRENINKINHLKGQLKESKDLNQKMELQQEINELKLNNVQLYRKGILQQKINSASKRGIFRNRLDFKKTETLNKLLNSKKPLTKNFIKKANLQVKIDKETNNKNKNLLKKKLEKLNEKDKYVNTITNIADKGIEISKGLEKNIKNMKKDLFSVKSSKELGEIYRNEKTDPEKKKIVEKILKERSEEAKAIKAKKKAESEAKAKSEAEAEAENTEA